MAPFGIFLAGPSGKIERHVARGVGGQEAAADAVGRGGPRRAFTDVDDDVMDHLAVAGPGLGRLHPASSLKLVGTTKYW